MKNSIALLFSLTALALSVSAADAPKTPVAWKKIKLESKFLSEGAHFADFNHDGKMDLVAGWQWFEGPDFTKRHDFAAPPTNAYNGEKGYSDYFLTYTYDFNGDGWPDILVYSWPGKEAAWYENPKGGIGLWTKHVAAESADNESPTIGDMNGDGKPELICHTGGRFGFFEADWKHPDQPWKFIAISPENKKDIFRYTHGYGFGDIDGDGRPDILEKNGWWEQPKDYRAGGDWKFHKAPFGPEGMRGGSQMLVYDVNGDKLNDVITSWDAHGYGLAWYEQVRSGGEITWKEHVIVNTKPEDNAYGVQFTQPHALVLADINGDGLMDFVTGKRFWAHGPSKDAEPAAPAVLYWFELKRKGKTAEFIPHLIDDDSGVGTQITAGDINGDGKPDIISSNKKGFSIFIQQRK
ncbi:MAG: VCBS repeat-containing protein [Verrucomicrobia bacterium]|nr:VCBS repeat-containing protein [Verrucomicrobiota bacterium]